MEQKRITVDLNRKVALGDNGDHQLLLDKKGIQCLTLTMRATQWARTGLWRVWICEHHGVLDVKEGAGHKQSRSGMNQNRKEGCAAVKTLRAKTLPVQRVQNLHCYYFECLYTCVANETL
mmetsp:Transcript_22881/g.54120  ORF Transcript_22881/g.54120 Transcript_22881/m.54120 type:complete len:120 (+) Transcript_22881:254-613(+)